MRGSAGRRPMSSLRRGYAHAVVVVTMRSSVSIRWPRFGAALQNTGRGDSVKGESIKKGSRIPSARVVDDDPSAVELTYGRAFSGDGTLLASARWPGVMAVWDLKRGKCVTTFKAPVNGRPAWGLALTKKQLVMGADGTAKVWVMSLPRGELVRTLSGMKGKGVWEVVLSPNEAFVAARTPSSVGVWSLETGKKLHVFPLVAWSLAFSADSKRLAMGLSGEIVIAEV